MTTSQTKTITDDNWPRRPDGSRKSLGEMSHDQQVAVVRGAVARLTPEFTNMGVHIEFKDERRASPPSDPSPSEPVMNRFSRDFALVTPAGRVLAESHNPERLEQFRAEFAEEGIKATVVPSDLPRSRPA